MLGDDSRIRCVTEQRDLTFDPQQFAHTPALFGPFALQQRFFDRSACLVETAGVREIFRQQA